MIEELETECKNNLKESLSYFDIIARIQYFLDFLVVIYEGTVKAEKKPDEEYSEIITEICSHYAYIFSSLTYNPEVQNDKSSR